MREGQVFTFAVLIKQRKAARDRLLSGTKISRLFPMFSLSGSKQSSNDNNTADDADCKKYVKFTGWIGKPVIRGSANPTDGKSLSASCSGFTIAVSLLVEGKQWPRYDEQSALDVGWSIYPIPIEEGAAPSLEQIREFINLLETLPDKTKVLVFCESGQGRTACMGAAYWVNKGLSANDAIVRMSEACATSEWATEERRRVLREYARLLGCQ